MKICDFTQSQLDYLEIMCNFTPEEKKLFDLRAKDTSLEDCAEIMNASTAKISRIHKRVIDKIEREA